MKLQCIMEEETQVSMEIPVTKPVVDAEVNADAVKVKCMLFSVT